MLGIMKENNKKIISKCVPSLSQWEKLPRYGCRKDKIYLKRNIYIIIIYIYSLAITFPILLISSQPTQLQTAHRHKLSSNLFLIPPPFTFRFSFRHLPFFKLSHYP